MGAEGHIRHEPTAQRVAVNLLLCGFIVLRQSFNALYYNYAEGVEGKHISAVCERVLLIAF